MRRAIWLGAPLATLGSALASYSDLYHFKKLGSYQLPPGALAIFALVLAGNLVLRKLAPSRALSRGEALLIYAATAVGVLIGGAGGDSAFMPTLVYPEYFATPANRLSELVHPYTPKWLVPDDLRAGARWFFEGLRPGVPIPWRAWISPVIAWSVLLAGMYGIMTAIALLVFDRWSKHERLRFPLMEVPLALVGTRSRGSMLRLRGGIAVAVAFGLIQGLPHSFPAFPQITSRWVVAAPLAAPWSAWGETIINLSPAVIGLSYIISSDVCFTLVGFHMLFRLMNVGALASGLPMEMEQPYWAWREYQALICYGGYIVLAATALAPVVRSALPRRSATGEGNVGGVARSRGPRTSAIIRRRSATDEGSAALGRGSATGEGAEANTFRTDRRAVALLAVSVALVYAWMLVLGLSALAAGAAIAVYVVFAVVLTRVVCEIGLFLIQPPILPSDVLAGLGIARHGADAALISYVMPTVLFELRGSVLPALVQGLKLAEETRAPARNYLGGMLAAVPFAFAAACVVHLWVFYRYGALQCLDVWSAQAQAGVGFDNIARRLGGQDGIQWSRLGWMTTGASFLLLVQQARRSLLWLPISPVGMVMSVSYPSVTLWASMTCGGILKVLMLRYGGKRLHDFGKDIAIGLVLGHVIYTLFWYAFDFLAGTSARPLGLE